MVNTTQYFFLMGTIIFCFCCFPGGADQPISANLPEYAPGYILVKTTDISPSGLSSLSSAHEAINASVTKDYTAEGMPGLQLVGLSKTMTVKDAITYYQDIPSVAYAEPDYYRYPVKIPSDPEFKRQWGLQNTGQVFKENISPGSPGSDIRVTRVWDTITGNTTIVAVLDSGVDYTHPDLAANIWTDPQAGTHGYDTISGMMDPMDQYGHGTHCAGIIGMVPDNEIGGSGVNWNVSIMPVRWYNAYGRVSDEITAILWASAHGATIMSCSYHLTYPSKSEEETIRNTKALFIIAAGNNYSDLDIYPDYPASYNLSNIITVAATTPNDTLASFSNFGNRTVHLGAPGTDIYSTVRSEYRPNPVWSETFDNLQNWTWNTNWTLDTLNFTSSPASVRGYCNNPDPGSLSEEIILIQNSSFMNLSGLRQPVLSYQVRENGLTVYPEVANPWLDNRWIRIDVQSNDDTESFVLRQAQLPITMYNDEIRLRFVATGWGDCNIDDVMLSDGYGTLEKTQWDYMDGTSMATPAVAGVAALLKDAAPGASLQEIRNTILNTTDPVPDLKGITITGGRINATAALLALAPSPFPDIISVFPGWNHISVPKRLAAGNDTAASVFGSLTNTSGHSIIRYQNNTWITVGMNESISPLSSYWIYTTVPQTLPYTADLNQSGIFSRLLCAGWNGFGVVGTELLSAKVRLSPVNDTWTYAIGYNPVHQIYEEPIIHGGTGNQTDSRILMPAQGYWVYSTYDVEYIVS
jgi:subtilisin family serine protease